MTGIMFDLKRFAVHDGGGIRSTLFLKGCPLRCPWCQNPEGIKGKPELWYNPGDCLQCKTCVAVCKEQALTLDGRIHIDHQRCTLCGACEEACPAGALRSMGREISPEEAARLLLRDQVFFGDQGGVTLSGGEVMHQWEFAIQVLRLCKEAGADTAIESCLLAPRKVVEAMLTVTDHFMIDIKFLDEELHRRHLGTGNKEILENYQWLVEQGADVLVRTPLIPGYTATEENIRGIARYIKGVDREARYELLNFNSLCNSKYAALEQEYPVKGKAFTDAEMDGFYQILEEEGIVHIIKE
ncbi:MAG: glycyl-radical enzyme activating protein [Lachnospiraceae bacterium]|nr:glycyl-radical enzyme activating protein [Lachnospiraceae bacterium]